MKIKSKLIYQLYKIFPKKFNKKFVKLFDHRLNYNLLNLIKAGIKIDVIYDIGAFKGQWSNLLSQTSLKNKKFYLFEANEDNEEFLKRYNFNYFIKVLSDKEKEVEFYGQSATGDSYFLEQTSVYKNNKKVKIKNTTTLDKVIEKEKIPFPNFIKIDTQGSELDILKGAKEGISNCSLIYLECPIIEYNLNAPNLTEYIKYLSSINFVPYDICEIHKIDNVVIQIDILFIKKSLLKTIHPGEKILNILN
tara:strand:- start:426 stop:1172 length:747 start_codon:yes stop_codon:yes gene_type:complete